MILTGEQIKWAKEKGYLDISPWDDSHVNPNSYNLRLANELMVYGEIKSHRHIDRVGHIHEAQSFVPVKELDMAEELPTEVIHLSDNGFILQPGVLYLGRTMEYTETHKFVPMLEGRSSVGRLGISIHSTAGFGDIGFCGYWTLEISCVQPVRIYPEVEICQIYYHTIALDSDIWIPNDDTVIKYESGKYQKNTGIQPSMLWKEFKNAEKV